MRAVAAALLLAACGVAPPQVTAADAERGHVALAELGRGRELLVTKCGNACHAAPLPAQHLATEWPAKLDEMSQRAGIDHEQRRLIEAYLVTMAVR